MDQPAQKILFKKKIIRAVLTQIGQTRRRAIYFLASPCFFLMLAGTPVLVVDNVRWLEERPRRVSSGRVCAKTVRGGKKRTRATGRHGGRRMQWIPESYIVASYFKSIHSPLEGYCSQFGRETGFVVLGEPWAVLFTFEASDDSTCPR